MYNNHQSNVGSQRPSQEKYDRFEAWLRENGAQFDLVSHYVDISTPRGLKVSQLTMEIKTLTILNIYA